MTGLPGRHVRPRDAGVGIVELIIYSAISALFLVVLSSIFIAGIQAERDTRHRDRATGGAEIITVTLQAGIRNASDVRVTGDRVDARVALGDGGWECQAWALADDAIFFQRSSAPIPSGEPGSSWKILFPDSSELKSPNRVERARGLFPGGHPFEQHDTEGGTRLDVKLEIIETATPVFMVDGIVAQAKGEGNPSACW